MMRKRVRVFWEEDRAWYTGVVRDWIPSSNTNLVVYDDGDQRWYSFNDRELQWAFDDVLFRRAPLSRWSEQYKAEFKEVAAGFV